jgi:excisionase family DNA binding protein
METKTLTVDETALALGVSRQTIYNYIRERKIKAVKYGKTWKVKESEIEYIKENGLRN